jgi:radical SAM protein with 4Fe4S-binding SPASM domain
MNRARLAKRRYDATPCSPPSDVGSASDPAATRPFPFFERLRHYGRVAWHYGVRPTAAPPHGPEDISIEVTNVCNFRCTFCPQSAPVHHQLVPKSYLSPDNAAVLLRKIREGGVRTNVIHWTHDGEPFVNKRFHEICAIGISYGFNDMYFATNGMLCTPARLAQLPQADCAYTFTIDFSADEATFESVRGTPGSWARVRANIARILNDPAYAHITIEVRELSTFAESDPALIARREKRLRRLFPSSPRLLVRSKVFHNACGFLPALRRARRTRYRLCPYPWTSLSVASNGDVVSCSRDLRHQSVLGNLFTQSLDEIWNGAAMQALRRHLIDQRPDRNGACAGCDMPYSVEKFTLLNIWRTLNGRFRLFGGR